MQMLTNHPVDIFHNSISPAPTIKPGQHAHKGHAKGFFLFLGWEWVYGREVQSHSKTIFITY